MPDKRSGLTALEALTEMVSAPGRLARYPDGAWLRASDSQLIVDARTGEPVSLEYDMLRGPWETKQSYPRMSMREAVLLGKKGRSIRPVGSDQWLRFDPVDRVLRAYLDDRTLRPALTAKELLGEWEVRE